jgi:hypothetical protein
LYKAPGYSYGTLQKEVLAQSLWKPASQQV